MMKSKMLQLKSKLQCHKARLHKSSCHYKKVHGPHNEKVRAKASEKKEWEDAVCSVCLEVPHNAVLLLCSSYDKGCRPYMCATSHRFSNCLEQFRKTYTEATPKQTTTQSLLGSNPPMDFSEELGCPYGKKEVPELLCPLCRGQVKGWTVVDPAREYLNGKKRACTQDNCSFVGTYKEIKKHVKSEHPLACPREVDPSQAEKWKKLENERDLNDVFSTIQSTTPGAIVLGDYVLETNYRGISGDFHDGGFFAYGGGWNGPMFSRSFDGGFETLDEGYLRRLRSRVAVASRSSGRNVSRIARPHARLLFARQGRRSRERRG